MTQTTQDKLRETLPDMATIEINVQWLDVGHVDEIFAVLPNVATAASCPFAMAYASPKLALHIAQKHAFQAGQDRIAPEAVWLPYADFVSAEQVDAEFFSDCLAAYAQSQPMSRRCRRLIEANRHYEQLIDAARQRIDAVLRQRTTCAQVNWIALPQLFVPAFPVWLYGSAWGTEEDAAKAINPNAVNIIALGEELIVPQQLYAPFTRAIDERLQALGVSLMRVDSTYAHFLNGGLHCNTSVVRTCRKKR